jgi:hypothetical protein
MSKAEMMESLDEIFTDRRLNRGLVETAMAATGAGHIPILGEYTAMATGGVSGRRGVFVFNRGELVNLFLSLLPSQMARLKAMGDPPPGK